MTTPEERAAALRTQLDGVQFETPADGLQLGILSTQAMLRDSGYAAARPEPKLDVRLYGRSIPEHTVPVRQAAAILGALQEAVTACGQAVTKKITTAGRVQNNILEATELRLSPALGFGSVVFHLGGVEEVLTGEELPDTDGSETLLDWVFRDLFAIIQVVESDDISAPLATESLRRLGPRTIAHLNDLAKEVTKSDIDIDMSWSSQNVSSKASLRRRGALALQDAIQRSKKEVVQQQIQGVLATASTLISPQLLTEDGRKINMVAEPKIAAGLGAYYNRQVVVEVELTKLWSVTTGAETLTYRLLSIELAQR
jgi:hypothetical protein